MKKILLPLFALAATSVSAQIEIGTLSQNFEETPGYTVMNKETDDAPSFTAVMNVDIYEGTNFSIELLGEGDNVKNTSCHVDPYKYIIVNGDMENMIDISAVTAGITGKNNPGAAGNADPGVEGQNNLTYATKGFQPVVNAKADGWIYVIGKLTTNKNYHVVEFDAEADGDKLVNGAYGCLSYKVDMVVPEAADGIFGNDKGLFHIQLLPSYEDEGTLYFAGSKNPAFLEDIVLGATIEDGGTTWDMSARDAKLAEFSKWSDNGGVKKNGVGIISFPVTEGFSYAVFGNGTKISMVGAIFSPENNVKIEAYGSDEDRVTLVGGEETALRSAVAGNGSSATYNLLGQKCAKSGLFIENGKLKAIVR